MEKKNYVYEVHSDLVSDISHVSAESPEEAIEKYCNWWSTNQKICHYMSSDNVTLVERINELI